MKISELLSIAGSIASITGFSLIWAKDVIKPTNTTGLITGSIASIIASLITIFIITLTILFLSQGHTLYAKGKSPYAKILYWSPALAAAIMCNAMLLGMIWTISITAFSMQ